MGSKEEIIAAIDAVGVAYDRLLALPLHTLTRSEQVSLLRQMDAMSRRLSGFDRQLIGRLITKAAPAQFGGASWAEVLSRGLRISRGEAERRIAAAIYSASPDGHRPSA